MDIITMTPTAALRSCSESFMVPSLAIAAAPAVSMDWRLGAGTRGRTSGVVASAAMNPIGLDVPTRTPMNDQHAAVRTTRTSAKPAAPPRGEPR